MLFHYFVMSRVFNARDNAEWLDAETVVRYKKILDLRKKIEEVDPAVETFINDILSSNPANEDAYTKLFNDVDIESYRTEWDSDSSYKIEFSMMFAQLVEAGRIPDERTLTKIEGFGEFGAYNHLRREFIKGLRDKSKDPKEVARKLFADIDTESNKDLFNF